MTIHTPVVEVITSFEWTWFEFHDKSQAVLHMSNARGNNSLGPKHFPNTAQKCIAILALFVIRDPAHNVGRHGGFVFVQLTPDPDISKILQNNITHYKINIITLQLL